MNAWRPPIDDPADTGHFDNRSLCDYCNRQGTEEEPLVVNEFGEQLCADCRTDGDYEDEEDGYYDQSHLYG